MLISIIVSVGPGSGIEKHGELQKSVVQLHLVWESVYDPTWWWVKIKSGLIGAEGLCTNFIDIIALVGTQQSVHFLP